MTEPTIAIIEISVGQPSILGIAARIHRGHWRVSHVQKMNLTSLRSFAGTALEFFTLRADFFATAARRKTPRRRLS